MSCYEELEMTIAHTVSYMLEQVCGTLIEQSPH